MPASSGFLVQGKGFKSGFLGSRVCGKLCTLEPSDRAFQLLQLMNNTPSLPNSVHPPSLANGLGLIAAVSLFMVHPL